MNRKSFYFDVEVETLLEIAIGKIPCPQRRPGEMIPIQGVKPHEY